MRQKLREDRFDFRGGLASNVNQQVMDPSQLVGCTNATLHAATGTIKLRLGSRRLHQTALGSAVDGVFQWDNAGTKQLVAVAGGDIFHKTTDFGAFTSVSPTPALGTELTSFATMRQSTSGAPLRLYLADGTNYWRWGGSTLRVLTDGATITLGTNPLGTTNTLTTVVVTDADMPTVEVGDVITIAGVPGAVNGIPAVELNGAQTVTAVTSTTWSFTVTTPATSTGSGGGSSVTATYTTALPANPEIVRTYHLRNFLKTSDYEQHAFWTVLGDPEDGTTGLRENGGSAMVDVLRGEAITALEVVGNTLLIGTPNSISKFTGYDSSDIQIEQDTQGISSTVGPLGKNGLARVETWAMLIGRQGVFAVSERELVYMSERWADRWRDTIDKAVLSNACVQYHEGNREVWVALASTTDTSLNKTVYIFNLDLNIWYGPYTFPFGIRCMARWEDSNGDEYVVAGCSDGFVRVLGYQTSGLDDVLYDASGGSAITGAVTFAPSFLQAGPGVDKVLRRVTVHAKMGSGDEMEWFVKPDHQAASSIGTISGVASQDSAPWRIDADVKGDRFTVSTSWSDYAVELRGFTLAGFDSARPSDTA